ncbi:fructose-6-phosphate aldolase, TalC/MipB family [Pilibacter termitis]|uniref:Fructose-6-phosphate aldolase, TalC/MipB family n=1 Tax=Pilibacter termitis TaxID=263852 RepID=A0A1T4P5B3_9ENTE|nr:fructose-6-phosphate aldolase [Pilibacter termitis]SJZ86639.1 fructose-6-phosphate aldolase, TalC/MipB family [Pilibacter termitis]
MEFMIDTANLQEIERWNNALALSGVTSNPSILKKEGKIDLYAHLKQIRKIIGMEKSLHVQVVAKDFDGMMKDAEAILENVDSNVFVKVPVNEVGLAVIKELKRRNINVTATAIYTQIQGLLAIAAGADYIAPYYNRMENLNISPNAVISSLAEEIARGNAKTKILGASYKNITQINDSIDCGSHAVTVGSDVVEQFFAHPSITKAVDDFTSDFEEIHGAGKTMSNV